MSSLLYIKNFLDSLTPNKFKEEKKRKKEEKIEEIF